MPAITVEFYVTCARCGEPLGDTADADVVMVGHTPYVILPPCSGCLRDSYEDGVSFGAALATEMHNTPIGRPLGYKNDNTND